MWIPEKKKTFIKHYILYLYHCIWTDTRWHEFSKVNLMSKQFIKPYYKPLHVAFELLEMWNLKKWTSNRKKKSNYKPLYLVSEFWTDKNLSSQKWISCRNNSWTLLLTVTPFSGLPTTKNTHHHQIFIFTQIFGALNTISQFRIFSGTTKKSVKIPIFSYWPKFSGFWILINLKLQILIFIISRITQLQIIWNIWINHFEQTIYDSCHK
jgi:hypothetical protein